MARTTVTGYAAIAALLVLISTVDSLPWLVVIAIGAVLGAVMVWVVRVEDQARRDQQVDEHDPAEQGRWAA